MWEFAIKILTPENTEIEIELAGIGSRFLALFIDYFIIFLINAIMLLIITILKITMPDLIKSLGDYIVVVISLATFFLTFNGYFILFEFFWSGRTPGKMVAKIRVIKENGQAAGFLEIFFRNILRIVDLILGPYFILLSKKEKRLGDYATGTIVIKEKNISVPIIEIPKPKTKLEETTNISKLTPKDFTLIGNLLSRINDFDNDPQNKLLNEFSSFYVQKIDIMDSFPPERLSSFSANDKIELLNQIYYAYQERGNYS